MKPVLIKLCTTLLLLLAVMTQRVWAVDVAPSGDNLDISNASAQVVWSKQRNHMLVAHYDPQSQLYWALPWPDKPTARDACQKYKGGAEVTFNEAQVFVKSLVVDGQADWGLPSIGDVERSNGSYSRRLDQGEYWVTDGNSHEFVGRIYHGKTDCQPFYRGYGASSRGGVCTRDRGDLMEYYCSAYANGDGYPGGNGHRSESFVPVRSRSIYDDIIEASGKSMDEKLSELTALLLTKKLTVSLPVLQAPSTPQLSTENRLDKGEFETTEAFQKRTDAENARVRSANEAAQRSYDAALKKYEAAVAAQQRELIELTQRNKKPEALSAALASAIPLAMTMIYGDPVLTDFKYDADKQTFSGILKSEKGGFNRTVEFAVPLSKAAQVKEKLGDSRLIPMVSFNTKGTELTFAKLDIVDDAAKQQLDFANAKKANTVAAYENFIKLYPSLLQAAQAKKAIGVLQASALAQERESQRGAAQAEQQERNFGMLGRCSIGSTVYHRERWDTTTSSGNFIADAVFGAATKEKFLIVFEGVVEGFAGDKVKVLINDYRVQQTKGGGFFSRKTYQGESLGLYADKYLGKTQYYLRNRCNK